MYDRVAPSSHGYSSENMSNNWVPLAQQQKIWSNVTQRQLCSPVTGEWNCEVQLQGFAKCQMAPIHLITTPVYRNTLLGQHISHRNLPYHWVGLWEPGIHFPVCVWITLSMQLEYMHGHNWVCVCTCQSLDKPKNPNQVPGFKLLCSPTFNLKCPSCQLFDQVQSSRYLHDGIQLYLNAAHLHVSCHASCWICSWSIIK